MAVPHCIEKPHTLHHAWTKFLRVWACNILCCTIPKASNRPLLACTFQLMPRLTHSMVKSWNDKHASLSPDSMSCPIKLFMGLAAS